MLYLLLVQFMLAGTPEGLVTNGDPITVPHSTMHECQVQALTLQSYNTVENFASTACVPIQLGKEI